MKANGKVLVVTGGGNGIGRQVVLQLLAKGAKVAAVDLDEKGLKETQKLASKNKNLSLHIVNITDKESVFQLASDIQKEHGSIDGYVNVAGIIQPFVHVDKLDYNIIERVMNVNFYGTLHMVKAFLPYLLERDEAHIVHISSMGGFVPVPGQSIYGASKAAVKLMTEGLYAELKDTRVKVTAIYPGGVATDISKNSNVEMKSTTTQKSSKMKLLTAEKAAEIIISGMEKNRYMVMAGKDAKFLNFLTRLAPKFAAKMIANMLNKAMG